MANKMNLNDTNAIRNLQDELATALDKMAHYDLIGSSKLERRSR
jgi:hypothetical protein